MSYGQHSRTAQAGQDPGGMLVQPGKITNCYYIVLSNLQKDTNWKHIKDFLRDGQIEEPDHVEVFGRKPYTAWIRVFGRSNFDKALQCFKSNRLRDWEVIADGRNAEQPVFVRNLKMAPLATTAATTDEHGAFVSQIPPLSPSNAPMPYTNPAFATSPYYATIPGTVHMNESNAMDYSTAHPTRGHHSPVVHKTGNEGKEMYAASSATLMDPFASLSLQDTGSETEKTSADNRMRVLRRTEGRIKEEDVVHFIRSCAPLAVPHILRIDTPAANPSVAIVKFGHWFACKMAREGMFRKGDFNDMYVIQGPDDEPASAQQTAPGPPTSAPQGPRPDPPASAPTGPRGHRSRKDQKYDRRKENDHRRMELKHARAAEPAGGSSSRGPGGASPSVHAAAGAPGPSSSSRQPVGASNAETEPQGPIVVDGTNRHHHKHRRGEKKHHK